jgi:hypothetical protein
MPLEAAAAGRPCIYAACTSLPEIVGREAATIVPWDAEASADACHALLLRGAERDRHLVLLQQALESFDWTGIVERLYGVYCDSLAVPYRGSAPRAWDELQREQLLAEVDAAYTDLRQRVAHGLPLIDRDGLLSEKQQTALVRISSRPWLRGPLLGPLGALAGRPRKRAHEG